MDQALETFTSLVKEMVDHPSDVSVEHRSDERGNLFTLKVNNEDLGQIIGKQGGTAKALRTILRVVGAKNQTSLALQIYEPERHRRPDHSADDTSGLHTTF